MLSKQARHNITSIGVLQVEDVSKIVPRVMEVIVEELLPVGKVRSMIASQVVVPLDCIGLVRVIVWQLRVPRYLNCKFNAA